ADLRLDTRAGAFADLGGGAVIVPGKPDESELYRRLVTEDEDERMPPADAHKPLTEQQVEQIRRWIAQGAEYQEHWAFEPPVKTPLSKLANDSDWPRVAVDHFIWARLQREGLQPQPEASRETLLRRVTFDLTGLPPTLEEIDAFVNDSSPHAYEKVVDRLLESKHYGEHMARFWLDAARYGDTHGLHLDNYREMWPYRDWVVQAFNQNMSFDRFGIEQLAGDLLPEATLEQQIASGFNRCHVTTNEGGTIPEEFYVRNVIDRVDTMGQVFMGLTLGCAVCHEHKYDPISQTEYYQLFAFFNNLDGAAMDGNVKEHPPFVHVPTEDQAKTRRELLAKRASIQAAHDRRDQEIGMAFDAWKRWQEQLRASGSGVVLQTVEPEGLILHFPLDESSGDQVTNTKDAKKPGSLQGQPPRIKGRRGGAIQFTGPDTYVNLGPIASYKKADRFSFGAWIRTPGDVVGAAISKMDQARDSGYELQIDRRRARVIMAASAPDLEMNVVTKQDVLKPNQWHHLMVTYDGSQRAAGIQIFVDGVRQKVEIQGDKLGVFNFGNGKPLQLGRRDQKLPLTGGAIDDGRFYGKVLSDSEVAHIALAAEIEPLLETPADQLTEQQDRQLRQFYLTQFDSVYRDQEFALQKNREEEVALQRQMTTTLVFRERREIRPAYLLERGEYDRKGEQVKRDTPSIFPRMDESLPRDRLGLAKWLMSPRHPLTARVTVNRFWQQLFGTGIVKTAEDFGSQGEPPSHPELLDWLAVDFRENGWDVKRLMKQLVMSAAYRQSSVVTPAVLQRDPENRLLARGPRFRLDAEMLRDQALAVSGLLIPRFGGPSVKPPQPDGLWFAVGYSGSNTVRFKADSGRDKVHRRTLYTFIKRTSPPPQMSAFDAPSRESCVLRRERTNTPLQALLLLNDPQYFEAARALAQRVLAEGGSSDQTRLEYMLRLCTGRRPNDPAVKELLGLLKDERAIYREDSEAAGKLIAVGTIPPADSVEPAELAAWTMVANIVLNLDEVVSKN
ncbi:MAG: DUF1553 domain-containing protein, partial [Pirellulales bacterium]|nr:DUF1553 domain-containing protein [Pirellulales bacterium]